MRDATRSRPGRLAALITALAALVTAAPAAAGTAPYVAAAGDIACAPNNPSWGGGYGTDDSCHQYYTANLLGLKPFSAVLPLGDLVYDDNGSLASYGAAYEPTWGRYKAISRPAIGNHEYDSPRGKGYWDYWNGIGVGKGRAGTRRRGWYSFNLGSWHLIALNSNCDYVSCGGDTTQMKWLRRDLEQNADRCVLAYFHHPRFSSGFFEDAGHVRGFWRALYRGGADLVLNGHEHVYERFAPQRPSGIYDRRRGISQFIVGTGGYFLHPFGEPKANSQFRWNSSFGILALRLAEKRFWWSFLSSPYGTSIDHGSRRCHKEEPKTRHRKHSG